MKIGAHTDNEFSAEWFPRLYPICNIQNLLQNNDADENGISSVSTGKIHQFNANQPHEADKSLNSSATISQGTKKDSTIAGAVDLYQDLT